MATPNEQMDEKIYHILEDYLADWTNGKQGCADKAIRQLKHLLLVERDRNERA